MPHHRTVAACAPEAACRDAWTPGVGRRVGLRFGRKAATLALMQTLTLPLPRSLESVAQMSPESLAILSLLIVFGDQPRTLMWEWGGFQLYVRDSTASIKKVETFLRRFSVGAHTPEETEICQLAAQVALRELEGTWMVPVQVKLIGTDACFPGYAVHPDVKSDLMRQVYDGFLDTFPRFGEAETRVAYAELCAKCLVMEYGHRPHAEGLVALSYRIASLRVEALRDPNEFLQMLSNRADFLTQETDGVSVLPWMLKGFESDAVLGEVVRLYRCAERLTEGFEECLDIREDLKEFCGLLRSFAGKQVPFYTSLALLAASLSVWTDQPELLQDIGVADSAHPKELKRCLDGFRAIYKGEWSTADLGLSKTLEAGLCGGKTWGSYTSSSFGYRGSFDCSIPRMQTPTLLLTLLSSLRAGLKATRIKSLGDGFYAVSCSLMSAQENMLFGEVPPALSQLSRSWQRFALGRSGVLLLGTVWGEPFHPANAVLLAAETHRMIAEEEKVPSEAVDYLLGGARTAIANRVDTLAALLLGVLSEVPMDEAKVRETEALRVALSGHGVCFWDRNAVDVRWKTALEELSALGKKPSDAEKSTSSDKTLRLLWRVVLNPLRNIVGGWCPEEVTPYRVGRSGPELRPCSLRRLMNPANTTELTEAEQRLCAKIERDPYLDCYEIDVDGVTGFLPDIPRLEIALRDDNRVADLREEADREHRKADPEELNRWNGKNFRPAIIERATVQLRVDRKDATGHISVRLPWGNASTPSGGYLEVLDESTYVYREVTPQVTRIAAIIRKYGTDGILRFPAESAEQVCAALQSLSAETPLCGNFAAQARGRGAAETLAGGCHLVARLRLEEGTLGVEIRVRPVESLPLLFEPGRGLAERTVPTPDGPRMLCRDITGETAALDALVAAMPILAESSVGHADWSIESLSDALETVAALKAHAGKDLTVEWQKGAALNVVTAAPKGTRLRASATARDWFAVSGTVQADDGRVFSLMELLPHIDSRRGRFLRVDGNTYIALTSALIRRLGALHAAAAFATRGTGGDKDAFAVPAAALPMLGEAFAPSQGGDADLPGLPKVLEERTEVIRAALASEPEIPPRLACTLRPYQEEGVRWLIRLTEAGLGVCLADDMGLGKTVQIIALLLHRLNVEGSALVVAPASVCGNWEGELTRFAPTLRVRRVDPTLPESETAAALEGQDVIIVSYNLLVSREALFVGETWSTVVLDEAQAIKNRDTKRAAAVQKLRAAARVVATGTPVENALTDLWSVFAFLNPGLLGPADTFLKRFTDADGRPRPELRRLVSPLILRRRKRDVLDDLPPKTEITLPVILSDAERTAYEACRRQALASLEGEKGDNRIAILAELTRLRRFCCAPSLVLPGFAECAKLDALMSLLDDLRANGHRALVFSQFTDVLALVRERLDSGKIAYRYLDGATPAAKRTAEVNAFQHGEGDFFLISLRAGGTGLNLTAANYVILLDPWWNPAVEAQAADRVHRIGQKRSVTVYRLVTADTVEEKVLALHAQKQTLAEDILADTGNAAMTLELLRSLFAPVAP